MQVITELLAKQNNYKNAKIKTVFETLVTPPHLKVTSKVQICSLVGNPVSTFREDINRVKEMWGRDLWTLNSQFNTIKYKIHSFTFGGVQLQGTIIFSASTSDSPNRSDLDRWALKIGGCFQKIDINSDATKQQFISAPIYHNIFYYRL